MSTEAWVRGLGIAAVFGVAVAAYGCQSVVNPPEKGERYLEGRGYTNVEGGDAVAFHTCGKGAFAREYTVDGDEPGERDRKVVCFGLWTHEALF